MGITISELGGSAPAAEWRALAALLVACVADGASVNFVLPFEQGDAERFYSGVEARSAAGELIVLVARDDRGAVVGSVQVVWAQQPNQPHRADVTKLLVHPDARRRGIGARLMAAAESAAAANGRTLLVLDTVTGTAADHLYRRLGWSFVGEIPGYALSIDGIPEPTSVFYKDLRD